MGKASDTGHAYYASATIHAIARDAIRLRCQIACAIFFSIAAICSRIFTVPFSFSAPINSKLSLWKCRTAQPEREPPADCERPTFNDYSPETFAACKPLGPLVTSNSTACPSFKDLYPSP